MEKKEQIIKHLKKYKAADVQMLYEVMAQVLLRNEDFRMVQDLAKDDFRPEIEEETGQKIDFSFDTILSDESLRIFTEIDQIEYEKRKLKKAERIQLLADVFSDSVLFEGFCLAIDASDEMIYELCNDCGCGDLFEELSKDVVYRNRKRYMRMISAYIKAAVNLYGVVHLQDLKDIICGYEKHLPEHGLHIREKGAYSNTIIFTPRYISICTLQSFAGNMLPSVSLTLDGLVLNEWFREEHRCENEQMLAIAADQASKGKQTDLDEIFDRMSDYSYRNLYWLADEKPMYQPSKKEFLKYEDPDYYEVPLAEKELRRLIEKKYYAGFKAAGERLGISAEDCINEFMDMVHEETVAIDKYPDDSSPTDIVRNIFDALNEYQIILKGIDAVNEIVNLLMRIQNSTRLWTNHGHTPMELAKKSPIRPGGLTVVPGSSQAAQMLSETEQELKKIGIRVDTNATATEVPTFMFEGGINGDSVMKTKKVYPNDPCPCGSGKKYKKCCGRGR